MQDIEHEVGLKRLSLSDPEEETRKLTKSENLSTTRAALTPFGWAQAVFTLKSIGGTIENAEEHTELLSEEFQTGDGRVWVIVVRPLSLGEEQVGVYLRIHSEIVPETSALITYTMRLSTVSPEGLVTSEAQFTDKAQLTEACIETGHNAALLHSQCKREDSLLVALVLRSLPSSTKTRERTGCVGLVNEGTTCYLNSLLQTFYFIGDFRQAVYQMAVEGEEQDDLPVALQRVFYCLQYSSEAASTSALLRSFGWGRSERNLQCDVQEFSCTLRAKLERNMKETAAEGTFSRLFEGVIVNYIKCDNVDYSSTTEERFLDLMLSVKGVSSLANSFKKYTEEEALVLENQYDTVKYGKQDAVKGVLFRKLPPVLQLQLKRFEFSQTDNTMLKVNDRFEFPICLDLNFCAEQPGDYEYTLFSILVHVGSGDKGHYFAFIRPDCGGWVRFDDEKVDKVTEEYALLSSFGGEYAEIQLEDGKISEIPHQSEMSAYMLVYIQTCKIQEILQKQVVDTAISSPMHAKFGPELQTSEKEKQRKIRENLVCDVYFTAFPMLKGWDKAGIAPEFAFDSTHLTHYAKVTLERKLLIKELLEAWKVRFAPLNYLKLWIFRMQLTGWELKEVREDEEVGKTLASPDEEGRNIAVYVDFPMKNSLFIEGKSGNWELGEAGQTGEVAIAGEAGIPVFLKWYQGDALVPLELFSVLSLTGSMDMNGLRGVFCREKGLGSVPLNLYIERCAPDARSKHMVCFPPSSNSVLIPTAKAPRSILINPGDCIICEIAANPAKVISAKAYLDQFQDNIRLTACLYDSKSGLMTTSYSKRFFSEVYRDTKVELSCRLSWTLRDTKEAIASELRLFDPEITWERVVLYAAEGEEKVEVGGDEGELGRKPGETLRNIVSAGDCVYFDIYEFSVKDVKSSLLAQLLYIDQNHIIQSQIDTLVSPNATISTLKSASKPKLEAAIRSDKTFSKRNPPVQAFLMQAITRHYICQLRDTVKVKAILENPKWQIVLRADLEPEKPLNRVFCYSPIRSFFLYLTVRTI